MKKLAYLILIAAIAVSGYFIYDTYKQITDDGSSGNKEEEEAAKSNIAVKYNEYNLNTKYQYALSQDLTDKTIIYFYNKAVQCTDLDVFKSINSDLVLILTIKKDKTTNVSESKVSDSSLFLSQAGGKRLEITGVPGVKNSISLTQDNQKSKLTGTVDLAWDNRTIKGSFESGICSAQ